MLPRLVPAIASILLLPFFAALSVSNLATAQDRPAPNFILILTDDQGWTMLSEPMHPDIPNSSIPYFHMPAINRLAREGMRFTSGYSPGPLCTPTRRSIQNGMTPARQRGTEFKSDNWIPSAHLTLPKALAQANPSYASAHFGKWGEDMLSTPEECGYVASDGLTGNNTGGAGADRFDDIVKEDPKLIFSLTKRANDFMARQVTAKRPFYLQLSHYAIHRQVQSLPATKEKYVAKGPPTRQFTHTCAAMLEDLNTGLTQLLDEIDRLGIAGNTYIVFTADNGGNQTYADTDTSLPLNNHPLRMGKQYLYEGGIRVPFIVRGPGIKPGSLCHEPVAGYDLLPTFYDLAGGKSPLPLDIDGGSFRPLLENAGVGKVKRTLPGLVFHRPYLAALSHSAYRVGDMKLVVDCKTGQRELFDLSKDISEAHNLAATQPAQTTALYDQLSTYLKSVNAETFSDHHAAATKGKNNAKNKAKTAAKNKAK